MKISNREKRDWSLLIFIVPIGIFLMMIAGQIAVRIDPNWSVDAGMQSNLELESVPQEQIDLIQPLLPDILTPLSWFDTFLTPNSNSDGNFVFPPFIIFEASATPTGSPIPPSTTTETSATTSTATSTLPATTTTPIATFTKKPPVEDTSTPPPAVCTDSSANNIGSPLPCTYTAIPSPLVGSSDSVPGDTNTGAPNGYVGNVTDGKYVIINLSPFPLQVNGPSDTGYDLVYYELYRSSTNDIAMDRVILSISSDGTIYYIVFNWGDGTPDANSNIGDVAATSGTENDNQSIPVSELYGTPTLQTGILIDVDNAPSHPPIATYQWLAIQVPTPVPSALPPNNGTDGADVDSVQVLP